MFVAVAGTSKRKSEQGFTLIELSIVLVLIGLIIGGVLKGQELIEGTRLKTTVAQWDAVKAAVNTFQDKYGELPGDYGNALAFIPNAAGEGDGDGVIGTEETTFGGQINDGSGTAGTGTGATANENQLVWSHLMSADLVTGVDRDDWRLPTRMPAVGYSMIYATLNNRTSHFLRMEGGNSVTAALTTDALTPIRAMEIDRKYDDGVADEGSIMSDKVGSATGNCHTDGAYQGTDAVLCTVILDLL